tara:strand:+ start:639 stop:908 length:270 start_codon:yes stop_codon:yes gene_type:complete
MLEDKLSRRKFISISFGSLIFYMLIARDKTESSIVISSDLRERVLIHNNIRKEILRKNINSAIRDDLINNKTTWIGKKLYTYAELFSLI